MTNTEVKSESNLPAADLAVEQEAVQVEAREDKVDTKVNYSMVSYYQSWNSVFACCFFSC